MFMFVRQRGCATSSFFQSPHLSGQIGQFLSSNELGKLNWAYSSSFRRFFDPVKTVHTVNNVKVPIIVESALLY